MIDDWTEEVKANLKELDIRLSLDEIKAKRLVKEFTLNYLLEMKGKHSKMENLSYNGVKLQKYLKNDRHNMKNGFLSTACSFCLGTRSNTERTNCEQGGKAKREK